MLDQTNIGIQSVGSYRSLVEESLLEEIYGLASHLKGAQVATSAPRPMVVVWLRFSAPSFLCIVTSVLTPPGWYSKAMSPFFG